MKCTGGGMDDASTLRGAGRGDLAGVRGGGGPERAAGPLQRGR